MRGWLRVVLRRSGEELGGGYQRRRDWGVCECMNEKRVGEVVVLGDKGCCCECIPTVGIG